MNSYYMTKQKKRTLALFLLLLIVFIFGLVRLQVIDIDPKELVSKNVSPYKDCEIRQYVIGRSLSSEDTIYATLYTYDNEKEKIIYMSSKSYYTSDHNNYPPLWILWVDKETVTIDGHRMNIYKDKLDLREAKETVTPPPSDL